MQLIRCYLCCIVMTMTMNFRLVSLLSAHVTAGLCQLLLTFEVKSDRQW